MHERATYESGGAGHLDLEDLAALVDGALPPEEAASARAHLARCEPCLALFTETASFLREDADAEEAGDIEVAAAPVAPLPFVPRQAPQPLPQPRRRRWAGAAAATAAVVALAVAAGLYQRSLLGPPQIQMARLIASLSARQAPLALSFWGPSQRSASTGPEVRSLASFRLGVERTNLDAALGVRDTDQAWAAAARINGLLQSPGISVGPEIKQFFLGLPQRIRSGAPSASFAADLQKAWADLEGYLGRVKADYDFGRWTEAGHLAAAAEAPEFLTAPDTHRFPTALRGELRDLNPRAGDALDEIAKILDRGTPTAEGYKALDAQFRTILETYYPV